MKAMIAFAVVIALWYVIGNYGLVSPLYVPRLGDVVAQLNENLAFNAAISLWRTIIGFALGISAAYLIHFFCFCIGLSEQFDTQSSGARAVPVVATLPLFLLWFGFSEFGRIFVVMLSGLLFHFTPLNSAYRNLPRELTLLKQGVPLGPLRYYCFVVIPGTLPDVAGSIRVTFAFCFTIAIAADYIGAEEGIGKMIDAARVTFNIPGIFAAIIAASAIGILSDRAILMTLRRLTHWSGRTSKS
jgi:ABC-type nitrate/sulfonate/bicarbonate transport system permease component